MCRCSKSQEDSEEEEIKVKLNINVEEENYEIAFKEKITDSYTLTDEYFNNLSTYKDTVQSFFNE